MIYRSVLCVLDQKDLDEIEIQQYSLTVIRLKDVVQDINMSVVKIQTCSFVLKGVHIKS